MHRRLKTAALVIGSSAALVVSPIALTASASAEVINVEFKFTPYVGDAAVDDQVMTVPGKARVFINDVPYAEQDVYEQEVPVLFEEREISPSVWLPAASCGPALRKGKNTLRVEFEPEDAGAAYRARLAWASVMSEATEESGEGTYSSTNMSGAGIDDKEAKGKIVLEREFDAVFATDMSWHHYAPVTALSAADEAALRALVAQRADAFKPDFAAIYDLVAARPDTDVAALREAKCLDAVYAAGARIAAAPSAEVELVTTGRAEVVIRAKGGALFMPADPAAFEKIEDEDVQMCAGMALSVAFPPRLVVVRAPSGDWEVVY